MYRIIYRTTFIVVLLFFMSSWGFLVHRTVHQLAVYQLPQPLQAFFYSHMEYMVQHSVRPDQRRNEDSTEAPKHFIDLEVFGDSAAWKMPYKWEEAVKQFSEDSLVKYGYVSYHIITMKNRLTNAFRTGNKDSILFYAADLGHYIGDANVPLHTSLNYDGQLTNQKGLHSLWESTIPEIEIGQYKLYSRHKAKYIADPEQAVWNCIRRAHMLLPDVLGKEIEASNDFTDSTKFRTQVRRGREVKSFTSGFAKAYSKLLGRSINDQLLHSASMIADFWYTAWVDAGKPDLSALAKQPMGKEEKQKLKEELKAWRKNELVEKKLLIARKQAPEQP